MLECSSLLLELEERVALVVEWLSLIGLWGLASKVADKWRWRVVNRNAVCMFFSDRESVHVDDKLFEVSHGSVHDLILISSDFGGISSFGIS